jgi:hypothetical protein
MCLISSCVYWPISVPLWMNLESSFILITASLMSFYSGRAVPSGFCSETPCRCQLKNISERTAPHLTFDNIQNMYHAFLSPVRQFTNYLSPACTFSQRRSHIRKLKRGKYRSCNASICKNKSIWTF